MKIINIVLSICICFLIFFFLNRYDSWGISEGICIYQDSSVGVALLLSSILFLLNFLFFLFWFFFKRKKSTTNIIFIVVSIFLLMYWHPVTYNYSIDALLKYTNIQIEQLGEVVRCELQRNNDVRLYESQKP